MEQDVLPPVICVMGPTASGKTDIALALNEALPCEIISVDSAQVYRGMDIGTAKPDKQTLEKVHHHLVNIRDPSEPYSAAAFRLDALDLLQAITARKKIPVLVGGTMLYFKALLEGMANLPPTDTQVRKKVEKDALQYGWPYIHEKLAMVDPASAAAIHPNHSQRLSRALEVYLSTGETLSSLHAKQEASHLPYRFVQFALIPENRSWLHKRIAERFQCMVDNGFIDEVRFLYQRGDLNGDLPSIRAVGYRQAWDYLGGNLSREEMIDRAIIATRQLAKRQLTWLRGWPDLHHLLIDSKTKSEDLLLQALKILQADNINGLSAFLD